MSFTLAPPGDPTPAGLDWRFQDGCLIVTVTGQLDLGSSEQFTRAAGGLVRATPGPRLILDLSGLTQRDSCGLAALITAQRQIDAGPAARMVLAGLAGRLARRLHDAGHARRFTVADTNADAIAGPPGCYGRRQSVGRLVWPGRAAAVGPGALRPPPLAVAGRWLPVGR